MNLIHGEQFVHFLLLIFEYEVYKLYNMLEDLVLQRQTCQPAMKEGSGPLVLYSQTQPATKEQSDQSIILVHKVPSKLVIEFITSNDIHIAGLIGGKIYYEYSYKI